MNVIGCKDAKAQGLKHYFTGKPCVRGHIDIRFVSGGCKSCSVDDQKRYYDENPEKYLQANRNYFQNPIVKESNKLRQRAFYANNSDLCKFMASRNRAARIKRIPIWANLEVVKEFYNNCPIGHEVAHIVPLLGELVSGLHVIENLQYLPMAENRSKHNKFEVV